MVRRAFLVAATSLVLVALSLSAGASTIEEATAGVVAYQYDGSTYHDAPDGCGAADPAWRVEAGGGTDGLLVAPDDVSDVYVLDVPRTLVGHRVSLSVADPTDVQDLVLDAFTPSCVSVQDLVNWPHAEPSPPAPGPGQQRVAVASTEPAHCEPHAWVFGLDGLTGAAPSSIYVAWTDGTEHALPLTWSNDRYAAYTTSEDLGVTLKGAWANLPQAWAGQFGLVLGPCDTTDGGAVYGAPPAALGSLLSFTPVRSGPYVVQVSWQGGALPSVEPPVTVDLDPTLVVEPHEVVEDPQGSLATLIGFAQDPPAPGTLLPRVAFPGMTVPASCHFCVKQAEGLVMAISYGLTANVA